MNKWISRVSREKPIRERATYRAHNWKMKSHASLEVFASVLQERPSRKVLTKLYVWQNIMFTLPNLYLHYIYHHYPQIVMSVFQRENPRIYTWELEIVILTTIYTFPRGFPRLLPLHLHILERLIAQTLTTLIQSVKWEFGAVGKYWKESFIGGCNWVELWDLES